MPATDSTPRDRSPLTAQLDNLIRRSLRISDPANPVEVAGGLRRLYRADDEAIEREERGLPILPPVRLERPISAGPSAAEVEQAQADIENDLRFLTTSAQLKDIEPELQGWGQAIRGHIADGLANARQALDPRARDRAFAARRALGDYARLARHVGALTPGFSSPYRRLAQSLDQVASLILVLMGESLAELGSGGGRFLLAAPASELVARRDAALNALRNLVGSAQASLDQATWPWGLRGYSDVMARLGEGAMADVRALFDENTLARMMDELIDRASSVSGRGLRALAATSRLALQRLERLVQIAAAINVQPASPPLAAFLEAVQLFIDTFRGGSAARLVAIARPPIVAYGLYGFGGPDAPTRRLQTLVVQRGVLAQLLDCYLGCECGSDAVVCQVLLDKLLSDVDRAIDLYAQGSAERGEPEVRAAAYGQLVATFLQNAQKIAAGGTPISCPARGAVAWDRLASTLETIRDALLEPLPKDQQDNVKFAELDPTQREQMREELCLQKRADERLIDTLALMTPGCHELVRITGALGWLVDQALQALGVSESCPEPRPFVPQTPAESLDTQAFRPSSNRGAGPVTLGTIAKTYLEKFEMTAKTVEAGLAELKVFVATREALEQRVETQEGKLTKLEEKVRELQESVNKLRKSSSASSTAAPSEAPPPPSSPEPGAKKT
ncbi:MAG: hypothetical protein RMJ04_10645 [Geminicoccaceae bacterium]|nr:hypothetical protein [Geminicoccaceae bacterium]